MDSEQGDLRQKSLFEEAGVTAVVMLPILQFVVHGQIAQGALVFDPNQAWEKEVVHNGCQWGFMDVLKQGPTQHLRFANISGMWAGVPSDFEESHTREVPFMRANRDKLARTLATMTRDASLVAGYRVKARVPIFQQQPCYKYELCTFLIHYDAGV